MDDDCYGNFDPEELRAATRSMKEDILRTRRGLIFCRHGLHRSVAGARYLAEELSGEGHEVMMVNLGLATRWWAKHHKGVRFSPPAAAAAAAEPASTAAASPPAAAAAAAEPSVPGGAGHRMVCLC